MKKKISALTLIFLLALTLTGCAGKAEEEPKYDQKQMNVIVDVVMTNFRQMTDQDFKLLTDMPDAWLDERIQSVGLPVERKNFIAMMDTWQTGIDECGKLARINSCTFSAVSDGAEITLDADFENRHADIVFKFDRKMNLKTMAVNAHYSISEILKKAGLNTILGMGTVFAVLIFISFIIYLFKFIPLIGRKSAGKAEAPAGISVPEEPGDGEIAAAIASAIYAYEGAPKNGFTVRSVRRRRSVKRR